MRMRGSTIRSTAMAILSGIALVATAQSAHAQKFEELFGGHCGEGGYAGVRSTVNGGYLSVGNTRQRGASCTGYSTDLYVVRIRDNGSLLWAKTYHVGNTSIAFSVIECSNGDFAITGATDTASTTCNGNRDAFILRINNTGGVVWTSTYGTATGWETGYKIIEAKQGAGVQGSGLPAPGDLIVAGDVGMSLTSVSDGYLFRTDAGGNLLWSKRYSSGRGDFFRGVTEAQVGIGTAGDLIAVGGSEGWSAANNVVDGFIVRVNGNNGNIGLAPQGVATYANSTHDVFFTSDDEIPSGTAAGDLVYTGKITTATDENIYVLHTAAYPCSGLMDASYGSSTGVDFGTGIRVVNVGGSGGLNNGNLVISGVSHMRGVVNADVCLLELSASTLGLVTPSSLPPGVGFRIYGALAEEDGEDVTVVPATTGARTAGFYLTGHALGSTTLSCLPPPTDPAQIYLIKTDNLGRTNCHDSLVSAGQTTPNLTESCHSLTPTNHGQGCSLMVDTASLREMDTLCNDSLHDAAPPVLDNSTHLAESGSDGRTSAVGSVATLLAETIAFLPNPVRRGERCNVTLRQQGAGTATIIVTDLSGHMLSKREERFAPGTTLFGIDTGDWTTGTYLITVTVDGKSVTNRVVLIDR